MGVKLVVAFVLSATTAHADVDWARGLVTADGIGIADRHAPTPATARGPARRAAEEAAKRVIATQLGDLPLAAGGTLKTKLADKAVKKRIDDAVARATAIAATLETDGSWKVTVGLPIEAIRVALAEPRALGPKGDADPAIVVVEGAKQKPALAVTVNGASAATVFVRELPAWAADAPRVKGTAKAGAIKLDKVLGGPATLYVVLAN
ncbi:MAG TPA: hypothetical protein VIU61_06020 [Kofleriaceae bacterium]